MASIHSLKALRPSLLNLPPALRVAAYKQAISSSRPFSCTPRRDIDPVSIVTAAPMFLMDSLHNIGLSWSAVIPCTAILLRGGLTYYLFTLPQRRMNQQRAAVVPLINAYTIMYRHRPEVTEKLRKAWYSGNALQYNLVRWRMNVWASMSGWWSLGYLTGEGRWRRVGTPLANFGILITTMEALRIKCGGKDGILSLLLTPVTKLIEMFGRQNDAFLNRAVEAKSMSPSSTPLGAVNPATSSAHSLPSSQYSANTDSSTFMADYISHPEPLLSPPTASMDAMTTTASANATRASALDPSLQTEGPWFCPDLTAVDSTGILPLCATAALAIPALLSPQKPLPGVPIQYSSTPRSKLDSKHTLASTHVFPPQRSKWQKLSVASKFQLFMAIWMYIVTSGMPAGMVLYFISSFAIGFVQRLWLDVKYPTIKPIEQCLRPVRKREKRLW